MADEIKLKEVIITNEGNILSIVGDIRDDVYLNTEVDNILNLNFAFNRRQYSFLRKILEEINKKTNEKDNKVHTCPNALNDAGLEIQREKVYNIFLQYQYRVIFDKFIEGKKIKEVKEYCDKNFSTDFFFSFLEEIDFLLKQSKKRNKLNKGKTIFGGKLKYLGKVEEKGVIFKNNIVNYINSSENNGGSSWVLI